MPSNGRGLDSIEVETVLPRNVSRECGSHRPVTGTLGVPDTARLRIEPAETGFGAIDRRVTFLPRDHVGHGPPHHLFQHGLDTSLADRAVLKFFQHVHFSCLDCGEQVSRPLYRFGEKLGA